MSFSARRRVGAGRWHRMGLKDATPRIARWGRGVSAGNAGPAWTTTTDEGADGHGSSPVTIQQLAASLVAVNETSRSICRGTRNEMLPFDPPPESGVFDRRASHPEHLTQTAIYRAA